MFLVNSRQRDFRCGPSCEGQALSLSYGRFFAEFLNDDSLVPLGLLALSTCVGLRYGAEQLNLEVFLERVLDQLGTVKTVPTRNAWIPTLKWLSPDLPRLYPHAQNAKPIRHASLFSSSFGYDRAVGLEY